MSVSRRRRKSDPLDGVAVADFETDADVAADSTHVWEWCLKEINAECGPQYGTDIDSFMARVLHSGLDVYFHNLRFDGNFITYWALTHGYSHIEVDSPKDIVPENCFSCLIDDMGMFYAIRFHDVIFKDSLKKLPMTVAQMAKAFECEQSKGEIDYTLPRPAGYEPTEAEWEYVRTDVDIVAKALSEVIRGGMRALTVASDALHEFRGLFGWKNFEKYFPVLPLDIDADIRRAYRGGFTYADRRTAGTLVGEGAVYDVNGLYSYIMRERLLPYGVPARFEGGPPSDGLWIGHVTLTAKIKKDHIPCIQVRSGFRGLSSEYADEISEPTTFSVSSVDWALWNDHYDIEVYSWDGGWRFASRRGFFDKYIDKWAEIKANSKGGKRAMAKLYLNSLYGKFGSGTDATGRIPVMEDGAVRLVQGKERTREPVYTALAVFVTSWARDYTIRTAQKNYDRFLYADTDSMHLLGKGDPVGVDVHPTRLGAWAHESDFDTAVFNRAKQYCENKNGVNDTHIAGLPRNLGDKISPTDMLRDQQWGGKLVPKRIPGGVILRETHFTYTAVRRQ